MEKITVIEDNLEVRENLVEILSLSGYEVTEAENGIEGLKVAAKVLPDLILCDVMMPLLDGFGVLKVLNRNPDLMHIPFMFLTAKAEKSDFRKGMNLGADDYITKPYDDVELLDAIEMRLKKSENLKKIDNSAEGIKMFFNEAKGVEELKNLSEDREIRRFSKKDSIYEARQYPKWMYYVLEGQVKCFQTNDIGKELITHIYGPGDFFGYLPILSDAKYEDSTSAVSNCKLKLIPPNDFKLLLFNNRDFAAIFIKLLAHHADESEKQLIEFAYSSVRKKVANALVNLSVKYGDNKVNIMREDLAALSGTAKETAIRTISDFNSENLIKISGGFIHLLDIPALKYMYQ